jgi:hypothetical protein
MSRAACLEALAHEHQLKDLSGHFLLWETATCSDRSFGADSSARYRKRGFLCSYDGVPSDADGA